jgi:hypothetical protein
VAADFNRFFTMDTVSGCWLWTRSCDRWGYGHLSINGRLIQAHRHSYELHTGPIPPRMNALHRCDVPKCVNRDHLFLGTHQDNMADMKAKGRAKVWAGEDHWNHTLTGDDVRQLRHLSKQGLSAARLGELFHIAESAAWLIIRRKAWKHIEGEGRAPGPVSVGEKHWCSVLTEDKVREMRRLHAQGVGRGTLAKQFGVSLSAAGQVVDRKSWKHVDG